MEGGALTVFAVADIEGAVPREPPLEGVELLGRGGTAYAVWRETWPGGGPVGIILPWGEDERVPGV